MPRWKTVPVCQSETTIDGGLSGDSARIERPKAIHMLLGQSWTCSPPVRTMNCNTQQGKGARGGSLRQRSGTFQRKGNTLREMTYLVGGAASLKEIHRIFHNISLSLSLDWVSNLEAVPCLQRYNGFDNLVSIADRMQTSKNFFYLTCLAVNISRGVHAQYWRPRVSYVKWTLSLDPRPSTHKYTFREQMLLDFIEVSLSIKTIAYDGFQVAFRSMSWKISFYPPVCEVMTTLTSITISAEAIQIQFSGPLSPTVKTCSAGGGCSHQPSGANLLSPNISDKVDSRIKGRAR
ncbi:hypothetical protein CPSG_05456 [Coccidioides posadasii str. Silveira]|uniref:Uncharacterized protein n=1 Tax=Coccidioides posadasii (strain RMSCC 757 / Silveira) TaxID=443226 RepID=E9D6E7_COCPS|nr:hypothetical protein CPSG_05456 [Coccidioides posadasii str. Silveira]